MSQEYTPDPKQISSYKLIVNINKNDTGSVISLTAEHETRYFCCFRGLVGKKAIVILVGSEGKFLSQLSFIIG